MNYRTSQVHPEQIEQVILLIRGQRVMPDRDLAGLYGVTTSNLNKAVKRNVDRFPADFMFRLTLDEAAACAASRFQFGILKRGQNIKLFDAIHQLTTPPANPRPEIGFHVKEGSAPYRVKRK